MNSPKGISDVTINKGVAMQLVYHGLVG
jgi:hypothetical protein